jgi:hypothetical protein
MNAIVPFNFSDMAQLADAIAKSGLFGLKTRDQALALMAIAHAEGRHPALAARDYDVISGRPAKKAEAMLRDFLEAGGKVEWHTLTDELADATFTHPQTGKVRIDWDMKRAQTAFGKKDMYAKFPRQMLRSRVVSEGVRTLWPFATSGVYAPEELADIPPAHNGPTIEAEPETERDAINREVPIRAAAAEMPRGARIAERAAAYEAPEQPQTARPRTRRDFLDGLAIALRDAQTAEEVDRIVCAEDVMRAKETFTNGHKAELDKLIADALRKWWAEPPADDLPEVEIAGQEKMAG